MPSPGASIPATGQEACFGGLGLVADCRGSGQDGELRPGRRWPEPRFEVSGGVVLDRLTGLEWVRDASVAPWPMAWDEAKAWAAGAARSRLLGRDGWRLPTRRELLYLTCPALARPALPPGHPFVNVFQHWHWTATASAAAPGHAWRVHLEGGRMFPGPAGAAHMVLPVRGTWRGLPESPGQALALGAAWPEPRFEVSGAEALDRLTGMAWLAGALPRSGGAASWEEALDQARRLGGGWRLPTIYELEGLTDASRAWPALSPGHPFGEGLDGAWSSTSSGYDPAWAWVLYFGKGAVGVGHKPGKHFKFLLTKGL